MKIGARLGGIAAAGVAVVALGACGNPIAHLTTERAVGNAFGKTLGQPGLSLQISLGVTPAQLQRINQIEHGGSSFTAQDASALGSLVDRCRRVPGSRGVDRKQAVPVRPQQPAGTGSRGGRRPAGRGALPGRSGVRRADIRGLLTDFGQGASAAKAQSGMRNADAYLPGLAALGAGKWVSVDRQQLAPLLKLGGANASANSANKASSARPAQPAQVGLGQQHQLHQPPEPRRPHRVPAHRAGPRRAPGDFW